MKNQHDPFDVLGEAYEKMYESAVKGLHNAEEKSAELLDRLVDEAKQKTVELEELSTDVGNELADYLKHDLSEMVDFFTIDKGELKDWLGFETTLLETEILDLLLGTADPTTVEWLQLKQQAERAPYHTGEITGPGTLVCDQCDEKLHFYKAGKIPPCPKCHATSFHRHTST